MSWYVDETYIKSGAPSIGRWIDRGDGLIVD
jgi:hypothetical protein